MGNAFPVQRTHCCYAPCLNAADALRGEEDDDETTGYGTASSSQKRKQNVFARSASVLASSDRVLADMTANGVDPTLADVMTERNFVKDGDLACAAKHLDTPREDSAQECVEREDTIDNAENSSVWSFGQEQQVTLMHSQGFHTTQPEGHHWQVPTAPGKGAIHKHQGPVEPGEEATFGDSRSVSFSSQGTFPGFQEVEVQRERSHREKSLSSWQDATCPLQREPLQLPVVLPARIAVDL